MYRRKTRMRQAAILCVILLAAGLLQWLLQDISQMIQNLSVTQLASWALYCQTGVHVQPEAEKAQDAPAAEETDAAGEASQPTETAIQISQTPVTQSSTDTETQNEPATEADVVEPLTFSAQEADAISVVGACTYSYDKTSLLQQPLCADFQQDGPQVLIVHTHTTEAYSREAGQNYEELVNARTLDERYNMIRVGQEVAAVLESHGIGVVHDTTINDYPSYNGSYDRMKTIIEENLAQYPTIQMVLDIHRDAAADEAGNPLPLTTTIQAEEYAKIMLVVGTDEGGLYHPNWQQNLSCALKLQALLNRDWADLCRSLDLRQERFNQNQTPCSLLVEFGTDGNTLAQALLSANAFGQALSELILASNV